MNEKINIEKLERLNIQYIKAKTNASNTYYYYATVSLVDELVVALRNQTSNFFRVYYVESLNDPNYSPQIVFSDKTHTIVFNFNYGKASYFDSDLNFMYEARGVFSSNSYMATLFGNNFECAPYNESFLSFSTKQFNKIKLKILNGENYLQVFAKGNDKVKDLTFHPEKNKVKINVVNCLIRNYTMDLEGNILSIGLESKVSKSMKLQKKQFKVNNYKDLINKIKEDLELYVLFNDSEVRVLPESVFDLQVDFIRTIIKEHKTFPYKKFSENVVSTTDYFEKFFLFKSANEFVNKNLVKHKVVKLRMGDELCFGTAQNRDITIVDFLNEKILNNLNYLVLESERFDNLFEK